MNNNLLKDLILYLTKNNCVSTIKLLELRKLSKNAKLIIETESAEIINILNVEKELEKKFYYNKEVYDKLYYKRLVIKNTIKKTVVKHYEIKIPIISNYLDNLYDDYTLIHFVNEIDIPWEWKILLYTYYNNPNVFINLYPAKFINKLIQIQKDKLNEIYKNDPCFINVVYILPICYTKHYKVYVNTEQYVTVLCYVMIYDKTIVSTNNYITVTLNLEDLDNTKVHYNTIKNYLIKTSECIKSGNTKKRVNDFCYITDVVNECKSITDCLTILLNNVKQNI